MIKVIDLQANKMVVEINNENIEDLDALRYAAHDSGIDLDRFLGRIINKGVLAYAKDELNDNLNITQQYGQN